MWKIFPLLPSKNIELLPNSDFIFFCFASLRTTSEDLAWLISLPNSYGNWNLGPIIGPSLTYFLALKSTNLFARIWWQVKYQHRQEWNPHAWNNDIYGVKKRFPSQGQIKDNVWIRLLTAGIILFISYCRNIHNVPLSGNVILLQIHAHVYSIVTT